MGIQIAPFGNSQFLNSGGQPASGFQLFVYAGRTADTKETVYTDKDGIGKHTNPIILDANGFPPNTIYIDTSKAYKFVLAVPEDLDPPTLPLYTVDQVTVGLETPTTSTAEWLLGDTPTYATTTQFSIPGDQTSIYTVGRRVKCIVGAGAVYGTITASSFVVNTTVTIAPDSSVLDNTLSAVYYGFLAAAGSSWPGGYTSGLTTNFTGPVTIPLFSAFNLIPVGMVVPFGATATPPAGYLRCNGQTVSRVTYAQLFAAIGITFGSGDGVSTYALPNISNLVTGVTYIIRYA